MTDTSGGPPDKGRGRSPGTRKEDWIASQLRQVYNDALTEAIPQRMLDLLDELENGEVDGPENGKASREGEPQ